MKATTNGVDLTDPQTIEELKSVDVMDVIKEEQQPQKLHTFTMKLTDQQIDRLARLNKDNDWKAAIRESVEAMTMERVGRAVISSVTGFNQKVTGPSEHVRY